MSKSLMSLRGGVRGRPALPARFCKLAAEMNMSLSMTPGSAIDQVSARKYARARAVLWWQVQCMQVNLALATHSHNSEHGLRIDWQQAPALSEYLQHTTYYWTGYRDVPPGRLEFNALQLHRAEVYRIAYDVAQVMEPIKMGLTTEEIWDCANAISSQLSAWYKGLPPGLRYRKDMTVPQYELQCAFIIRRHTDVC